MNRKNCHDAGRWPGHWTFRQAKCYSFSLMNLAPEKLLGEFLRLRPHTRDGQWECAYYVEELVKRNALGVAQILEYPEWPNGTGEKF